MSEPTPSIEQARRAYEVLKQDYPAAVIQRRLGLSGQSRHSLDHIVADAGRRTRLVNWAKSAQLFDEQYERRGPR
ncbi:hypothetical protein [Ensifer adhaerens]|jgi:hypothetical protein|uniref:hypothetical protein n=1 Tax=Ensifer adhaerens TaxID=106592 RepID=UPI00202F23FD|nr:hypothetical protein [Ensifer adhaerens]